VTIASAKNSHHVVGANLRWRYAALVSPAALLRLRESVSFTPAGRQSAGSIEHLFSATSGYPAMSEADT
jgi:hypothetical protein